MLIKITITTSDDILCKKIEPNVSKSSERFTAIKKLTDKGIFAGILLMPVLPFIEDTVENIIGIINLGHVNGARFIYPAFGVTLRQNQREWYYHKLDEQFPGIKEKYIRQYGNSYECQSPKSKELWKVFQQECNQRDILYRMDDIIKGYKNGYGETQMSMFD